MTTDSQLTAISEPPVTDHETTDSSPSVVSAPTQPTLELSAPTGGAPALNANHLKHGLNADPAKQFIRLTLGALPKSLRRVETDAYEYRQRLENAVADAHGEISLTQAHAVDTAVRWFRHGQAALAWLRKHETELTADQRLAYSKAIAEAADKRDKAIDRLKLDAAHKTLAATLYPGLAQHD